jgi:hypothetical protein
MQHFTQLFDSLSPQEKSDYLLEILENEPRQKQAFIERFKKRLEKTRLQTYTAKNIEEMLKEIYAKAADLKARLDEHDFEETDWERGHMHDHYVPEWELAQEIAEEEAMEIFEPCLLHLEIELDSGNLTDIAKELLTIYHGARQSNINDPYNNLSDDPEGFFIDKAMELVNSKLKSLEKKEFLNKDYEDTFDLMFKFFNINYSDNKESIREIAPLLISIIKNKEIAEIAWKSKNEYKVDLSAVPKLITKITGLIGDNSLRIKSLEECFLADPETSINLMDYYFKNDKNKFENNAPKLYARYKHTREYLVDKIAKGSAFHIVLLKDFTEQDNDLKYFAELKNHLSTDEISQFIDNVKYSDTRAKLLAYEKRFDDLLQLIKKEEVKNDSFYPSFNFAEAVSLIAVAKPAEAFDLVKKKITKLINGTKNKGTYSSIAFVLNAAKKIVDKQAEVETLIKEIYNHKPNLPSLKEIFRSEGLV